MKHPEIIRLDDGKLISSGNHMLEVAIPFDGFYESFLSYDIDQALESLGLEDWPEGIKVKIAKRWVEEFNDYVEEETGIQCKAVFEDLVTPREYNFACDQLFVKLPLDSLHKLFDFAGVEAIAKHFVSVFTSRSGFSSFYDPDLPDYDLVDWDQPLLGEVVRAAMLKVDPEHQFKIYQRMSDWVSEAVC
jgi:hypothetical protein